jgi:hypothetical protein
MTQPPSLVRRLPYPAWIHSGALKWLTKLNQLSTKLAMAMHVVSCVEIVAFAARDSMNLVSRSWCLKHKYTYSFFPCKQELLIHSFLSISRAKPDGPCCPLGRPHHWSFHNRIYNDTNLIDWKKESPPWSSGQSKKESQNTRR